MGLRDNIAAARRAGHSEEDINAQILDRFTPRIQAARERKFSDDDIRKNLKAGQVPDVIINDLLGQPTAPAAAPGPSRIRGAVRRTGEAARAGAAPIQVGLKRLREIAESPLQGDFPGLRRATRISERIRKTKIPGAARARAALERGPEFAGEVAQFAAEKGLPFPAALGAAAGVPTTAAATLLPVPQTVGELGTGAATIAAFPAARALGPRAFPVLGRPVGAVLRRARQRIFGVRPGDPIEVFPEAEVAPRGPGLRPRRAPEAAAEPEAAAAAGELPFPDAAPRLTLQTRVRGEGFELIPEKPRSLFEPSVGELRAVGLEGQALPALRRAMGFETQAAPPTPPLQAGARAAAPPAAEIKAIEKKGGKPLIEMTKAEFKAAAPGVNPAVHTDAIRKAIRARKDIPRKVEEENLDIIEEFEEELRGAEARELRQAVGSPTPVLDLAREKGLSIASLERTRGMGEVENLRGRGIFRQKGGVSISDLAEAANESGLIPENADNQVIEALNHELSTGQPLFPVRAMEFGPVSPISGVPGGIGGFAGPRPPVAPPPPEEPLGRLQSEYEAKILTGTPNTARTTWPEALDNLYTAYVDRTNPINNLSRFAKDAPDFYNLEFLTRRWMGSSGIAEANLRMRTSLLGKDGNVKDTGEGLAWILREADQKGLYRDLSTYMVAMRDLELARAGKKGLDPKAAEQIVVFLKSQRGNELQAFAERWWDWRVRTYLDPLLDIGAISQSQYDTIRASGQVYAPFQRVMEDLDSQGFVASRGGDLFTPSGTPLKRFKGIDAPIVDPAETDIQMAYFYADYVERVRIGQGIWESRKFSPELAKEIVEIPPKMVRVGAKGREPVFARSLYPPEKNALPFLKKGKLRWMRVPSDVADAVQNMRATDLGFGMDILSFPARTLRAGVVLDPEFSLGRNVPRDVVTAAIFAKYGIAPANLIRGLMSAVTGNDKLHFKWMASGSDMATITAIDRANANVRLAQLRGIREIQELSPLELLRRLTEISEQTTRKGIFDRASRAGATDLEAMYESRTGTVDFGNQGASAISRAIRMMVPFHGASLSGLATMGKAFRRRPGITTYRSILSITVPSVILWLARLDDEDLQEIPQWEKDAFWVGKFPGTDRIWRIPKPHELGLFFGTAVEHVLDFIFLNDPQAMRTLRDRMFDVITPPIIPPLPKVAAEVWANKSTFTDRPVIPSGRERLDPELQFGTYTSETAKAIGKKLKISPSQIDHTVRGLSGTLGTTTVKISDAILRKLKLVDAPERPKGGGPLEGIFFAKPPIGSRSKSVNRFFEILSELEREQASRRETSGVDLEPGPELELVRRARKQIEDLSSFTTLTRATGLSPEEKARRIEIFDRRKTKIARQIVRIVENRQRQFKARSFFQREEVRPPQDEATKSRVTRSVRAFIDAPNQGNRKAMNEALREGAKADPELTLRARSLVIQELADRNLPAAFEVFNEMSESNQTAFLRELGQSEKGLQLRARLFQEFGKRRGTNGR